MPKDKTISSILVIGSGPIVIGQAAEFDYAGTQACIALKEEGYKVILVNNNPATIMTDPQFADRIYFEPLTVDTVEKIIEKEKPDGLLATLGGQTGLNLALQLSESGILTKHGVKMLGTSIDSIKKGEDREAFRKLMKELNEPVPDSAIVHSVEEAMHFSREVGFPIIVRPAYTLGGTGGGIAENEQDLLALLSGGLKESPIHQCLIEKSIAGYKEIEFEVMRDINNTCITVCSMENLDPVGIHTGDSIVVAPVQTLTDVEYEMLRDASLKIVSALGIVGGCNIQFALDVKSNHYFLIEVNPRVSRSSALASKATGYPIARVAAKLAVGYTLSEIANPIMDDTFANFEPTVDYCIVKIPKWPFDKFSSIDRKLGTQMKATGEVMGIDRNFQRALMKAIHSLELKNEELKLPHLQSLTYEQLLIELEQMNDERLFILLELMRRRADLEALYKITKIDLYFLMSLYQLIELEEEIESTTLEKVTKERLQYFKEKGFSDAFLATSWRTTEMAVRSKRKELGIVPVYKTVDTCSGQFSSYSNYYYSSYYGENEQIPSNKRKIAIIGSGPIRIGQGIEFDYCSVHGVYALKEEGIETILINNNPETVSTDYATSDKLYFEPLILEDILNVLEAEQIEDCIIQLGGQTALNLAAKLEEFHIHILGTSSSIIDMLEDRKLFYQLLEKLDVPHLQGELVYNEDELLAAACKIGYPVLLRPSYVIGGAGMEIFYSYSQLNAYIEKGVIPFPVLVDQFLHAKEAEIDLVTDGKYVIAPVIMEHIEKTGVHSGDSMSILPAQTLPNNVKEKILLYSKKVSQYLQYKGLMNIQFIIDGEEVYVLEVNPRASRTVPIVSKITGIPLVQIATKILLGKYNLSKFSEEVNQRSLPFVAIKYPVFSNYALPDLDSKVSAEMKSTGEGICIGRALEDALRKVFHQTISKKGKIIVKEGWENFHHLSDFQIEVGDDEGVLTEDVLAYFNPGNSEIDKKMRAIAVKRRILTFTEVESFMAFLKATEIKDFSVTSIEDWLLSLREDVAFR